MTDKKPKPPTKRGALTTESLKARGFLVPKSSGEGFGVPLAGPQPKPPAPTNPSDAPTKRRLTDEDLIAMGFRKAPPSGKGYFLPAYVPPPKKTET